MLVAAGYPADAGSLDDEMVKSAAEAVMAHLENEGDLRSRAIDQELITA
jgi:hypothetical protein